MAIQDPNFAPDQYLTRLLPTSSNRPATGSGKSSQTNPAIRKVRILSIDGGGIRGIISATIINYLEEAIQQQTGNQEARLCDYFDLIAGTSTGGILTCAYLTPNPNSEKKNRPMTAGQALDLYKVHGKEIFTLPFRRKLRTLFSFTEKKYSSRPMERLLQEKFGRDSRLSELVKPCLITSYNFSSDQAMFFNQLDAKADPSRNFRVWEVARATSAAPTYFEPVRLQSETGRGFPLVDGGLFAANPAMCAYIEAHKTAFSKVDPTRPMPDFPICRDMLMVSISTGNIRQSYDFEKVRRYNKIQWAKPAIDMMMSAGSNSVDYQMRNLFETCRQMHGGTQSNYYRLNPDLETADTCLDNVREKNLNALHQAGLAYIDRNRQLLDKIVGRLIDNGA